MDVSQVHSLLGLWVWAALLKRDLLSAPHALFGFVTKYHNKRARWWASARREWWTMAGLLMGMVAGLGAPLSPRLYATDAQGAGEGDFGGYGIVAADV